MIETNFSTEELTMLYESVCTESGVRNLSWERTTEAEKYLNLMIKLWQMIGDESKTHPNDRWF